MSLLRSSLWPDNSPLNGYTPFHLPIQWMGILGVFHVGAVMHNADAVNIRVQVFCVSIYFQFLREYT